MSAILTEIMELLTGGITGMATGLGTGLQSLVSNIFVVTGEGGAQTLSTFGAVVVIFAGISLAVGLSRWVVNFIASLGARNR